MLCVGFFLLQGYFIMFGLACQELFYFLLNFFLNLFNR
nr:MAG TPA: hypothetical protein [Caudoviricetes sp.]